IKKVTLFPDRAQIYQEGETTLPAGKTILKIKGLSPKQIPATIQVEGYGDFMIMAVNQQTNFLENPVESADIQGLRKQIKMLTIKIEDETTAIGVLKEKEVFLVANRLIVGREQSISSSEFKILTDQYVTGIGSVRTGILKKSRVVKELEEEKKKLENQLSGAVNRSTMPSNEVLVTVTATKSVKASLSISYLVINAGWYPSYDIRVTGTDFPATIFYKANAWQNTGVDWKEVKLSFSSATPSESGILPVLNPWYINFFQAYKIRTKGAPVSSARKMIIEESDYEMADELLAIAPPVTITDAVTNFSFDLNVKQNIRSDGKVSVIELQRLKAEASYKYIAIPKLKEDAFLTADIPDWESLNLLDGEANIYFGNTYTGKTFINRSLLSDTLNISLGKDAGITVKREKRKDYSSTRMIGSNRQDTRSYLISVRNNRKNSVNIVLHDQIPLSQNSQITVEATDISGGILDKITGKVRWDIELKPNESEELIVTYTVKYPKNQRVILEN
ncbi:MAG: DUF4139 domain-containing protein, partial [Bacteroidales bacterium]|nr:DUF4139 domain-containing protein [Bacteroidales bacterium]